jgi:hypothetical protein
MPLFVWGDSKAKWWIRESRTKAGMWSASIIVGDPPLQNSTQVVFSQRDHEVQAFAT